MSTKSEMQALRAQIVQLATELHNITTAFAAYHDGIEKHSMANPDIVGTMADVPDLEPLWVALCMAICPGAEMVVNGTIQ